ncbi:unnamed protein product [Rotaria sp. Silwood2]|nr:unnamed protein product [Rotaria sp. Silwood2]
MADVSHRIATTTDNSQSINEHVLCRIQAYSNGIIVVEHDFNNGKLAYVIETGYTNKIFYQYYLEHASISPPPNILKLNIFGELVSGKNFDYDNIYVYYCLDLADNWYVESSMILSGYTHTASTTSSSKYDDIVYYSHPFEFEIWYKPSPTSVDHELPRMPKIYFQIFSLDSWGRHRIEDYTYIDIPNEYEPAKQRVLEVREKTYQTIKSEVFES